MILFSRREDRAGLKPVRNEQLIDPAAGAVVGDSAPAPCHVGNQVLRSRDDPFERATLGRAIAWNKLQPSRRLGGISRLVARRRRC